MDLVTWKIKRRERRYFDFSVQNATTSFAQIATHFCMRLFTIVLDVYATEERSLFT